MNSLKSLLLVLAFVAGHRLDAAFIIVTETSTTLSGNFSVSGNGFQSYFPNINTPPIFGLLPAGPNDGLVAVRDPNSNQLLFGNSVQAGLFFNQPVGNSTFAPLSGSYVSGLQTVDWSLSNFENVVGAGASGTFSGNFAFQVRRGVPDSGSATTLLAVALLGLFCFGRSRSRR